MIVFTRCLATAVQERLQLLAGAGCNRVVNPAPSPSADDKARVLQHFQVKGGKRLALPQCARDFTDTALRPTKKLDEL